MVAFLEKAEDVRSRSKGIGAITLFVDDLEVTKRFSWEIAT